MIRISLISKHYQQIEPLIQQFFDDLQIEYKLTNYTHQTIQDIYFVEIEKKNDLNILKTYVAGKCVFDGENVLFDVEETEFKNTFDVSKKDRDVFQKDGDVS